MARLPNLILWFFVWMLTILLAAHLAMLTGTTLAAGVFEKRMIAERFDRHLITIKMEVAAMDTSFSACRQKEAISGVLKDALPAATMCREALKVHSYSLASIAFEMAHCFEMQSRKFMLSKDYSLAYQNLYSLAECLFIVGKQSNYAFNEHEKKIFRKLITIGKFIVCGEMAEAGVVEILPELVSMAVKMDHHLGRAMKQ